MVGREREVAEGGEGEARARPAGERAEEGVVGEERGGAPREDEARVGVVAGGGERGGEGGEVGQGGEAGRDEEVRVERAEEVRVGRRGEGREHRGRVAEQRRRHRVGSGRAVSAAARCGSRTGRCAKPPTVSLS